MMSRKDYVPMAALIKSHAAGSPIAFAVLINYAEDLADLLASDNPRFDRARFLAACGV